MRKHLGQLHSLKHSFFIAIDGTIIFCGTFHYSEKGFLSLLKSIKKGLKSIKKGF